MNLRPKLITHKNKADPIIIPTANRLRNLSYHARIVWGFARITDAIRMANGVASARYKAKKGA